MTRRLIFVLVSSPFVALVSALAQSGAGSTVHPWPQFRGPDGNGVASADGVPLKWSETESLAWKTELPGKGWSSPVVTAGGKIWLTTAIIRDPDTIESSSRRCEQIAFAPAGRSTT